MAARLSATAITLNPFHLSKPTPSLPFTPLRSFRRTQRTRSLSVSFFMEDPKQSTQIETEAEKSPNQANPQVKSARVAKKFARKRSQRLTYLVAAVLCSVSFASLAAMAVYYRFSRQKGGLVPWCEIIGTFALSVGAAVGMEFWARWAHRALWHASLWYMHESHHRPREGPFELNDVFAITNAVPAIALISYGFLNEGLVPGLCFGAGIGITAFGMAYVFVHDGLVHKRFPVGPIANVPYLRRVAAAHRLHHSDRFNGVPYGLFLGPKEVEEAGGIKELEKEISRRTRS